eukprot:CAMPEP_0117667038 /NCGR_PEP_ID=MMETSP0804-20121206/10731_1 /TAXON_ID=1074897 /ORGANISM="Tetraselmis astigmatica, Strain CCMP880" /LENGTH=60 /DNA_ID=CAMNT_0005474693 /DNA_START=13 /DNA_END=192 /DNA_ORIENTATION=-
MASTPASAMMSSQVSESQSGAVSVGAQVVLVATLMSAGMMSTVMVVYTSPSTSPRLRLRV